MGTSKMRFLFLLGALLVLFAEVAYPQGEDYQGKRGKHGFDFWKYYQGKRGKHGFLQGKRGKHGFFDELFDSREDYQGKRGKHGFLQGKRGKHGFIRDEEDSTTEKLYGIDLGVFDENNYKKDKSPKCSTDSDCGDGECCRIMEHRIGLTAFATCGHCDDDYQGKRGKHGFFSAGEDYHGKR